ncbi:hypothetical protein RND81_09G037900 [Saponaria officinalis]|uniref:NAC domain-containing protein n=1 Tax=Saponaria officinalis TaxID=3572 RepID=A0AAW1IH84_SAPOF
MAHLPPGYKFIPTKVELINYYLKRKINGEPFDHPSLPKIFEDDIYRAHPRDIIRFAKESTFQDGLDDGSMGPGVYFFTTLKSSTKKGKKNKSRHVANSGTWEQQSTEIVEVEDECGDKRSVIGVYKYFKFKPVVSTPDQWRMHEYSILEKSDRVLCQIVEKVSNNIKTNEATQTTQTRLPSNNGAGTSATRVNLSNISDNNMTNGHQLPLSIVSDNNELVNQDNSVLDRFIKNDTYNPNISSSSCIEASSLGYPIAVNNPTIRYPNRGIDTRNRSYHEMAGSSTYPVTMNFHTGHTLEQHYKHDLVRQFYLRDIIIDNNHLLNNVGYTNMVQITKSDTNYTHLNQEPYNSTENRDVANFDTKSGRQLCGEHVVEPSLPRYDLSVISSGNVAQMNWDVSNVDDMLSKDDGYINPSNLLHLHRLRRR